MWQGSHRLPLNFRISVYRDRQLRSMPVLCPVDIPARPQKPARNGLPRSVFAGAPTCGSHAASLIIMCPVNHRLRKPNFDVRRATCGRCAAVVQCTLRGFGGDHQGDGDLAAVAATALVDARTGVLSW
jgi:hypothetical protein